MKINTVQVLVAESPSSHSSAQEVLPTPGSSRESTGTRAGSTFGCPWTPHSRLPCTPLPPAASSTLWIQPGGG